MGKLRQEGRAAWSKVIQKVGVGKEPLTIDTEIPRKCALIMVPDAWATWAVTLS